MTRKLQLKHLSTEGKHLHIYYHRRCVFLFPLDIAVFAGTVMSKLTSHTWFQIYDVLRHLLVPCKTDLCLYARLQWHYNGRDGDSNYQPHHCLLNRLFRRRSKKTSKLHVTGLWAGNSPVTGEFPAQMTSDAENVSIWWRHHEYSIYHPYETKS